MVLNIPGGTWTEEQVKQTLVMLVPSHWVFIFDLKTSPDTSYTYVLTEWKLCYATRRKASV